jgi:alpha-tubulin suppressor-like RCC1 family protein/phosphodiesterase/alkaline phosphatase D-like protein
MTAFFKHLRVASAMLFALAAFPLKGAVIPVTFTSSGTVPITEASYDATGKSLGLSLGFAPPVGTTLTVVRVTGLDFIQGSFDNLVHGQRLDLSYGGITYPFVVNYYGGSGNDLVLQWANHRMLAWGSNSSGQLGLGDTVQRNAPEAMADSGLLAGKTILSLAAGSGHSLALCADGTLAAWGSNSSGQLGNNSTTSSDVPVAVDQTGVLAGKVVVAIAAGRGFNLVLCRDGTLVAWGANGGNLGNNTFSDSWIPVSVDQSGVLAGKKVISIAAGENHALALCLDGTIAAWGSNSSGQLGVNNTGIYSSRVPVEVVKGSVLTGKTITAVGAGSDFSFALCSDSTLAAWGNNGNGQLGNNTTTSALLPVAVTRTGVLAGKTITGVSGGGSHVLALCSDSTLAAWGYNGDGQLGNNSTTRSTVPVLVNRTGVLSGKTIISVSAGIVHGLAVCSDGTLASWGGNSSGQLGNNSTTSTKVPVLVNSSALRPGERRVAAATSSTAEHNRALVASPPRALANTWVASSISDTGANLAGSVIANGTATTVKFEYGLTQSYGLSIAATPSSVSGTLPTPVSATVSGLLPGKTYHYRVVATNAGGTSVGTNMTFTTGTAATLAGLTSDGGNLLPSFDPAVLNYSLAVPNTMAGVTFTPLVTHPGATVKVGGVSVVSGSASGVINLNVGNNPIPVAVTSADGAQTLTYMVTVSRLPDVFAFNSAGDVPLTVRDFDASGKTATFALGHAPIPGSVLKWIENTGFEPIRGEFDNLPQGQTVVVTHHGIAYSFVVNYFGGTGNDLELIWANNRLFAWGRDIAGVLGNKTVTDDSLVPVPVDQSGVLAGKTIIAESAGLGFSLALCSDGTLASWGANGSGQLGNSTSGVSEVPVPVDTSGVLAGKRVIAITSGASHSLALCTDGTVAAWGVNQSGQLGNNDASWIGPPVLVNATGALTGKKVIAISAGDSHSLALCSDGSMAAWGRNLYGQLGNNSSKDSATPVAVDPEGVLLGKRVVAIASALDHNLALCSDGTLVAWGRNHAGQLGGNSILNANAKSPIVVSMTGALSGKSVKAIKCGSVHSMALCTDGSIAAWGGNGSKQLGDNSSVSYSLTPVAVSRTGVLSGKTPVAIAAGWGHSAVICSDGAMATFGDNAYGKLGNGSFMASGLPVLVSTGTLRPGERFAQLTHGRLDDHVLAVVASPPAAIANTLAAGSLLDDGATLRGVVNANGTATGVSFEYGPTPAYGRTVAAKQVSVSGTNPIAVSADLTGLPAGSTWHYRVVAEGAGGRVLGEGRTFTTTSLATLTDLSLGAIPLSPGFAPATLAYSAAVSFATTAIAVTPTLLHAGASAMVNGVPVASGSASAPIALAEGPNLVSVAVLAADGVNRLTYTILITRIPETFRFVSTASVGATVDNLIATGNTAAFELAYHPTTGTALTVIHNTGMNPIQGTFDNLAHGQRVDLIFGGIAYPFVANYFGGSGNDLVLQWANNRAFAWGNNSVGQLGVGTTTNLLIPVASMGSGVLAGRVVTALTTTSSSSVVLCADGTLATWGSNSSGQLGNNSAIDSFSRATTPVMVDASTALLNKLPVAVSGGGGHVLALCADGSLVAWGGNGYGQLGDNTKVNAARPVAVNQAGVLAGKRIVAVSAGGNHSLALCSDGTMAAWGDNQYGQLGNNSTTSSSLPVAVDMGGVLGGKKVLAIAAGQDHNLALCTDGTLVAWGANGSGRLGINSTVNSPIPVAVDTSGVLSGKTVTAISGGGSHSLVLCSDGTLASWGNNNSGTVGSGSSVSNILVPAAVSRSGVLSGRTIVAIEAGHSHSLAVCSDGSAAAWGYNFGGQLGNDTTYSSNVPVLVNVTNLTAGERFVDSADGAAYSFSLGLVASPPPPFGMTLTASGIKDDGAVLQASVMPGGGSTTVSFEYGTTTSYGTTVAAVPAVVSGVGATTVSREISGLLPGVTYHYRVVVTNSGGTRTGENMSFTTSTLATLEGLAPQPGELSPSFDRTITQYRLTVPFATGSISLTPVTSQPAATVKVNGAAVVSGTPSAPIALATGTSTIPVQVDGGDGINSRTYQVVVTRLPERFSFPASGTIPVTVSGFTASGDAPGFVLGYAPAVGESLVVVRNTGSAPIEGEFANLAQGQVVVMEFGGISYPFVADYSGGDGNDLVMAWANRRLLAWGNNSYGQLGDGSQSGALVPSAVARDGVLAGKSVSALGMSFRRSLAVAIDGTLATWGENGSQVPAAIDRTGDLAGRRVVQVVYSTYANYGLCSDGTLIRFGSGSGDPTPVIVPPAGALVGRRIVAISAGNYHALALCADGGVVAWGTTNQFTNNDGQLGNNSTESSVIPVNVHSTGVLAGKTVKAIAAGGDHNLALCTDGTLVSWGDGNSGQLGTGSSPSYQTVPVAVQTTGVLSGKTVVAISAGTGFCLVLCSDGTLAAWGRNYAGQLGNNSTSDSNVPVLVSRTGVLAGRTVTAIRCGNSHNLAFCSDGSMVTWGGNTSGQLGDNSTTERRVPVLVNSGALRADERVLAVHTGCLSAHNIAIVAAPPPPTVTTLAANGIADTTATLDAAVAANGSQTQVHFEYGLNTNYGRTASAAQSPVSGTGIAPASAVLTGLLPGTVYHFRVIATNGLDTAVGEDMTFITTTQATLAGLVSSEGSLIPGFSELASEYAVTVPAGTTSITLTAVTSQTGATLRINGAAVESGVASAPIPLAAGNTAIPVVVASADGLSTRTHIVTVTRVPDSFAFQSAAGAALTVTGFDASGIRPDFSLGFAPPVGTELRVIDNRGSGFIRGIFGNLPQGSSVALPYGGIVYQFVANYFGGDGNDLVLQWANTRLTAWGHNDSGQLGDLTQTSRYSPVAVESSGVLAGRTVIATACGSNHSLALCADGTLAAWGANSDGQLGDGTTSLSLIPVAVDRSGALAGKTIVALAAGSSHSLALCSDGTLVGWGSNSNSQLGNIGAPRSLVPVAIEDRGVLTGREIVSIATGSVHNLALCADGTLGAWGGNHNGQLGDGSISNNLLPVAVGAGGLLDGRKVVAIAAAQNHNLAVCDDGAVFAWGVNTNGQLGDQSKTTRLSPVLVNPVGALAGKKPVAVAAGYNHSIALCADGSLAAWGYNGGGELGNGSTTSSLIPVSVTTSGVLAGKTIVRVDGAGQHNLAQCADGTLATWGYNSYGRLGNGNTGMSSSSVPVLVDTAGFAAGERFVAGRTGVIAAHGLGLVASPPLPVATTLAANAVGDTGAILNAAVQASGAMTSVSFEYGLTAAYGNSVTASPATASGTEVTPVSAPLAGLLPGTTYHFRVKAVNAGGTIHGGDQTFTTGNSAGLANLVLTEGSLSPAFDGRIRNYVATLPFSTSQASVTATPVVAGAGVKVNQMATGANGTSGLIDLAVGNNVIDIEVNSADGNTTQDFTIVVTRLPERFIYQSAGDVPVTAGGFVANGMAPGFSLGFKPGPGTTLTVVNNTGNGMIDGLFGNLPQGQIVEMDHEGIVYQFVASYSGGTGNDLVLEWANRRMVAWGYNASGQLGNDGTATNPLPGELIASGALAGKVVLSTTSGTGHTLALCSDGSIAAWGYNLSGQLGDGSVVDRLVPVAVDASGVLAGRRVIRLAAGGTHSLALCADGALVAWGNNNAGQLGLPVSTVNSPVPVLVDFVGALAGKSVVSIAAGDNFSFAVCSDGTVVSWGSNGFGQLGNNSKFGGPTPVAVEHRGVLAGKEVVAVAGGYGHAVALCSDGTLATWGRNDNGELGTGTGVSSSVPVLVNMSGALAGKTVTAISSGVYHCLVRCSDGTLASWGYNGASQLGHNSFANGNVPVLVDTSGVLAGRKPVAISAGAIHNVVVCEDGFVAAWGTSVGGSLGDGTTTSSNTPIAVSTAALRAGERFAAISSGSGFNIGLIVAPPMARAATLAATDITDHAATLRGEVGANGSATQVHFEFGLTDSYGSIIPATPSPLNGIAVAPVSAVVAGLLPGTTYHYRMAASGPGGVARGGDMTFTTSRRASLAGIALSAGSLSPAFEETRNDYSVTLPVGIESITVTPLTLNPGSVVRVNGVPVASGSASEPIALTVGETQVDLAVDAGDGVNTNLYQITVGRLPAVFGFSSPTDVPVTTGRINAGGLSAAFELRYHPEPGSVLTVVNQTGPDPIGGTFQNISQGELVLLSHGGTVYQFVADYFGGNGNDLVLRWANSRPLGWGSNAYGQLGTGVSSNSLVPVALKADGALAGKTLIDVAAGARVGLGLCSDGTLAVWGDEKPVPVSVSGSGVLAGRRVVAIAAGELHYLALCSDGTVAAWGWNGYGQLGDNSMTDSAVPVAVDPSGVLAGKRVIALAAGYGHSLALCSDGTIASWGVNSHGQLGNQRTNHSPVPVLVSSSGVLSGKRVVAIAAGQNHNLALCSDGTLVSWGNNDNGRLGDNSSTHRFAPVAVDVSGVLAGKSVTGISAGFAHSMVLTSDGTVACWGSNSNGRLGDGTSTDRLVPVVANTAGVLAGKTIVVAQAGKHHSMALCSDGTLASWGSNGNGELGNNTTNSSSNPVIVNAAALAAGEKLISVRSGQGSLFNLAMVASPPQAVAVTLAATSVGNVGATLNGRVHPNGNDVSLSFEYGTGPGYGNRIDAIPAAASGTGATDVSVSLSGLQPGETYHYRIVARSPTGVVAGDDMTFTVGAGAALADLKIQPGAIYPAFDMSVLDYSATVASSTSSISVTAVTATAGAGLKINGSPAVSGSVEIPLIPGENAIAIDVTSPAGSETARYNLVVTRLPAVMHFGSAADVPLTAARLDASGHDLAFSLGFAPEPGTRLLAIRNSGAEPIQGTFNGLPQGGTVVLVFGGKSYSFVANYFGGTGNDLVLEWAATRVLAWGANEGGQLGSGTLLQSPVPQAVRTDGVLAGRTVISLVNGEYHTLALCADGTLAAWGANGNGQIGDGSSASSAVPVRVNEFGVLAGRTVVAIAAGSTHSLALCSDGTLAAWGYNTQGQLGDGGKTQSRVPVAVKTDGVLANRKIHAIAAGEENSYVVCTDGTVAAWGRNNNGQLGDGGFISSSVPVQVDHQGVLAGKSVVSIAAGQSHVIALCSDGTLVGWGYNGYGNLGNNSTSNSAVPVAVDRTGVLAGRTVVAIASGQNHSVAALSDGTAAAWGYNGYRQLGNGAIDNSIRVPVLVNTSGVLAGKSVTSVAAGANHCLALCSDGTLAAWGRNSVGQLGNGSTTNSDLPVEVSRAALIAGERAMAVVCGADSSSGFVLVASPYRATVTTLAATQVGDTLATLGGAVNPDGLDASLFFDYGPTAALGETITAQPASASGSALASVTGAVSGLIPGTTYHFRMRAVNSLGTVFGETVTFTTGTASTLASLAAEGGILNPSFASGNPSYALTVPAGVESVVLRPVASDDTSTIRVNGAVVASGASSDPVPVASGNNTITVRVTTADGSQSFEYVVTVTRLPGLFEYASAGDVPVTVATFSAAGQVADLKLGFAPLPGTELVVVDNTGRNPIHGEFNNIPNGGTVALDFDGNTYHFVASYHGGDGNDLVLRWANTRLMGLGFNTSGQLGNGLTANSAVLTPAGLGGAMSGKRVLTTSTGGGHTLALCTDGSLAAWGANSYGQLGNGTTTNSLVPVAVDQTGVLTGRTIVSIATGQNISYALCSDGTLVGWGYNGNGLLGDDAGNRNRPVEVPMAGALAGRRVSAIAAGEFHALALCTDGTLAAWGFNGSGRLGNGNTLNSTLPVAVDRSGVLRGKTVMSIAAGSGHNLALCTDGTVVAWGANNNGQLGDGSTVASAVPVAVDLAGLPVGITVTSIAAGWNHSLALCSDGSAISWGYNNSGQLGDGSTVNRLAPVQVDRNGVLANRRIVSLRGGGGHSYAFCEEGTIAAWGHNGGGQLGNNSQANSSVPVDVTLVPLRPQERIIGIDSSPSASSVLALVASPLQSAVSLAATDITGTSATLHGLVNPAWSDVSISFEYGLDASYGMTQPATPGVASGNKDVAVSAGISGLLPGTVYHFRVVVSGHGGVVRGRDLTFLTLSDNAHLAGLRLSAGTLAPAFERGATHYVATVPFAAGEVAVIPTTEHPGARVLVDGAPVASGSQSGMIRLEVGNTTITNLVTAEDGITTKTYTVTVTRLPLEMVFRSASDVPVSADGFNATGIPVKLVLAYPPLPGTILTVVRNSSLGFIYGNFANLSHGSRVSLGHGGRTYDFVVNYYGGSGNDLVLQWADTRVFAWGANTYGQVGDASTTRRLIPTAVNDAGALAGKTVVAVSGGYLHSIALCSDGSLAAWGYNAHGQLGNDSSVASSVPVPVDSAGVLAGKTVVAISAGPFHNLALCSDGTVAAWGNNNYGQLGNGSTALSRVPVQVHPAGALAGKQVVGVAAGSYHSFALCADGSVAAWGYNDEGELGDGTVQVAPVPVAVRMTGSLAGKRIASLAAGQYHTLALCTDGTLAAWGYNNRGQLGNQSTVASILPVETGSFGALAGRTVVAVSASGSHSLALCADGTLAAWGWNHRSQLGAAGIVQSDVPVAIGLAGDLGTRPVAGIAAGATHNLLRLDDGSVAAWGDNTNGQLGDGGTVTRGPAAVVDSSAMVAGSRFMFASSGSAANHSLAVVGLPTEGSPSLLEAWRAEHFGSAANAGEGADCDDCDRDGIPNLVEYAFGLNPLENSAGQLPRARLTGGNLVLRFTRPAGVSGITYGAEWSSTLLPGDWTDVPDTGNGDESIFSVPMGSSTKAFLRIKVSSP